MISKILGLWLIIEALISITAQEIKKVKDFRRSAHAVRLLRIIVGLSFVLLF